MVLFLLFFKKFWTVCLFLPGFLSSKPYQQQHKFCNWKLIRIHLVECNALRRFINGKFTMSYNFWINSGVLCGFQLTATFIALFIDSALLFAHNFFVFILVYFRYKVGNSWFQVTHNIQRIVCNFRLPLSLAIILLRSWRYRRH